MQFGTISGQMIYTTDITLTGVHNAEIDRMIQQRLRPIKRFKCSYCQVWVELGIGLCSCCGAPLPETPTLIEP